jgi:hypothetical protein
LPRHFRLKHVERGIYVERELQAFGCLAAVAEGVLNHPGVICNSGIARAEPRRFGNRRFSFRVALVSVLTYYKMVAKIPVVMPVS